MVKPEIIDNRLLKLQEYLEKLAEIKKINKDDFFSDFRNSNSAKYLLQVCIECCLDIAAHIIASEKLRRPSDYADSFRVLHENKIISDSLINNLVEMAKFRNRIVHIYWEIDEQQIYSILQSYLDDFQAFIKSVSMTLK